MANSAAISLILLVREDELSMHDMITACILMDQIQLKLGKKRLNSIPYIDDILYTVSM